MGRKLVGKIPRERINQKKCKKVWDGAIGQNKKFLKLGGG